MVGVQEAAFRRSGLAAVLHLAVVGQHLYSCSWCVQVLESVRVSRVKTTAPMSRVSTSDNSSTAKVVARGLEAVREDDVMVAYKAEAGRMRAGGGTDFASIRFHEKLQAVTGYCKGQWLTVDRTSPSYVAEADAKERAWESALAGSCWAGK